MNPLHPRSLNSLLSLTLLLASLSAAPGCVKQALYDAALSDVSDRDAQITDQLERMTRSAEQLSVLSQEKDHLVAEIASLRGALAREGADRTAVAEQADALARSLAEAQLALDELRARQAEALERNRIYQQLLDRFRAMIDAGTLDVAIEDGRIVIKMRQDVLFDSGSAKVNTDGKAVVAGVATALAEFSDRRFQVEGHTDNVPIKTERFPSNWELSTARATAVVKLLADGGVLAPNLSAAGYSEFQPRAPNDDADGRALNRRITIVMLPEIQQLPDLD